MNGDAPTDAYRTEADAALIAGNLALAEALAQEILRAQPDNPTALAMMAHIAGLLGLEQASEVWRARLGDPAPDRRFGEIRNPYITDYLGTCRPCRAAEKFLLVKAWGFGFWADVFHVLGALLLAEITGRTPYVYWGANSLFSPDPATNAFALYFAAVNSPALNPILGVPSDQIFPAKWGQAGLRAENVGKTVPLHAGGHGRMAGLYLLNRPERLVVSDFYIGVFDLLAWIPVSHPWHGLSLDQVVRALSTKYLVLQDAISAALETVTNTLAAGKYVAVHVRGSDKIVELAILERANREYEPAVRLALERGYDIFLMTDSVPIEREYREKYGDRVMCLNALRTDTDTGTHRMVAGEDRYRAGREVVIDVMAGAGCDRFLGNGASNPSCMIDFLIADQDFKHLFIPNQNRRRFVSLYRDG